MMDDQSTVLTPRMTFFCRSWGEDDGIPVMLLHGSYGTSRWWERFALALPEEIYALAPDLRGCGGSSKPDTGYGIEEQAADVEALVRVLGWDDFHLVAHSSSGAIAIQYALHNHGTLSTLTLVSTVPVEGVFTPIDGYMLLEQMRYDRALLAEAMALLMPRIVAAAQDTQPEDQALFELLVDDALQMAPAAFVEVARSLSHWNRFAEARQLTLPTLLVWGDQDVIVDREATTRTLIAIPGANNLEVLRGVGHSPMLEAPNRLSDIYVNFITQDFAGFDAIRGTV
jgi:branched-chain amino acid transport system permease protein